MKQLGLKPGLGDDFLGIRLLCIGRVENTQGPNFTMSSATPTEVTATAKGSVNPLCVAGTMPLIANPSRPYE